MQITCVQSYNKLATLGLLYNDPLAFVDRRESVCVCVREREREREKERILPFIVYNCVTFTLSNTTKGRIEGSRCNHSSGYSMFLDGNRLYKSSTSSKGFI